MSTSVQKKFANSLAENFAEARVASTIFSLMPLSLWSDRVFVILSVCLVCLGLHNVISTPEDRH